jgi:hypothetical protein
MKRMHLIEIADLAWCPPGIRHGVGDFCRFLVEASGAFNPIVPLLAEALQSTGARQVLDLGSGAAGPWLGLQPRLRMSGIDVPVCLSGRHPDLQAFERAGRLSRRAITYRPEPVDATRVPNNLPGFRTMFNAFHHLRPEQAHAMLADAVAKGEGVGVFECGGRSLPVLLGALATPLRVLVLAPFVRPFRWSRLFWTYLVPALPLVLLFDVVVSCLRVYSAPELRDLIAGLGRYHWEIGTVRKIKCLPISNTYLIGVPSDKAPQRRPDQAPAEPAAHDPRIIRPRSPRLPTRRR